MDSLGSKRPIGGPGGVAVAILEAFVETFDRSLSVRR
jgi:hypothetical protein